MASMIGRTLGHYRIESKLGAGGMGVVYKARDTHLDRFVALKMLPPEKTTDLERKRRFVQEAKAASALNHPNILHIYDIETAGDLDFIAMEYFEGQTLADLISRKGLPVRNTLRYAVQMADGLAAAHAAGIVHRDVKPGNIMVNEKGLVKILDFGLAKLTDPAEDDDGATQTIGTRTEEGTIVGTVAYMSPEQAEAKKVDPRSDIFSFGSVLYEMVTGQRAFQGSSKLATLSVILHQEPKPLEEFVAQVPYDLPRLVALCLRKDPARRFQHMEDVKVLLEQLWEESDTRTASAPRAPATASRIPLVAKWMGVIAISLALLAWYAGSRGGREVPLKATFTQLTDQPGAELYPSLSPDGKSFVYQSRASGNWDIYLQRVGGKNPINLTKDSPSDDTEPAFSPDGERIAFRSERDGGGIFIMGATGESVKRLTDFGHNPAWTPDGSQIVCATTGFSRPDVRYSMASKLYVINLSTGSTRLVTAGIADAVQPSWSPRGHRIAFWGFRRSPNRDIWTIPAQGGPAVSVTDDAYLDWNPVWSPDAKYLYFASDRGGSTNVWRVPIEETSGKLLGPPEMITTPSPYSGYITLTRDGRRLAYVQLTRRTNLHKVQFNPATGMPVGPPIPITGGAREIFGPDVSPDGRWVAFTQAGKQEDIWVVGTDGTGLRQLTDDIHRDRGSRWSPDGKHIAFFSNRSGRSELWVISSDGSQLRQLTDAGCNFPVWSPDGERMLTTIIPSTPVVFEPGRPWKEQAPRPLPSIGEMKAWFQPWSWSPDGRRLAGYVQTAEGGRSGIATFHFESHQFERLTTSGENPRWLPDGRRLLFADQGKIYLLECSSRKRREVLSAAPDSVDDFFSLSYDGRLVCFGLTSTEADVWLASLE